MPWYFGLHHPFREHADNPIDVLARIVQSTSTKPESLQGGCPINNLAQEMSSLAEGFRQRLAKLFSGWSETALVGGSADL
jgi:TetR/AcrR family transcriptional regulator, transcriptional repressor for nem operon